MVFDVLAKYLRSTGKEVFYLQNIIDVDDKIIRRAEEEGVSQAALALISTRGVQAGVAAAKPNPGPVPVVLLSRVP